MSISETHIQEPLKEKGKKKAKKDIKKPERLDRFILSYNGNKYIEAKKFLKNNDEIREKIFKYKIIVEPYGGIFGFSRACYEMGYTGKFIINDINKDLIDFFKCLKKDIKKAVGKKEEEIKEIEKLKTQGEKNLYHRNKSNFTIKSISRGMSEHYYDGIKGLKKIDNFKKKYEIYKKFFKKVSFYNMDSKELMEKFKGEDYFYYLDPPYFNSNNKGYQYKIFEDENGYQDGTAFYVDIFEYFKNGKKGMITVNKIALIDYLLNKYKIYEEKGVYQNTGKSIKYHITYGNI